MQDPFVGTWKLNPERCEFDPNHRPTSGTLVFTRDAQGLAITMPRDPPGDFAYALKVTPA